MRFSWLSLILCLSLSPDSIAQSAIPYNRNDSLFGVWQDIQKHDTVRMEAFQNYIQDRYKNLPDSLFFYAQIEYDFAKKSGYNKWMASSLSLKGLSREKKSQYAEAIQLYNESLVIYQQIGLQKGIATALGNIGTVYWRMGNYSQGLEFQRKSLEIHLSLNNKLGMANTYNNLGLIYQAKGDYDSAIYYHSKSLAIREEIGEVDGIAMSTANLGNAYAMLGEYLTALDLFFQSLVIKQQRADKKSISNTINSIGNIYLMSGDFNKAIEYYEQGLELRREVGDKSGVASSLNNIGLCYENLGIYIRAKEYHLLSFDIRNEIGDLEGQSNSYNNLANIYALTGDYSGAIQYYQRSIELKMISGNKQGLSLTMNNLASVYIELAQLDSALVYFNRSLVIKEAIGDKRGIATTLNGLGKVNMNYGGKSQAAESYFKRSLQLREEIGDKGGVINSKNNLAELYLILYDSALVQQQGDFALTYLNLAIDFAQQGLNKAIEVGIIEEQVASARILYRAYLYSNNFNLAQVYLSKIRKLKFLEIATNYFAMGEYEKELYFSVLEKDFGSYYDFTLYRSPKTPELSDTAYNIALQNKGLTLKSSTVVRSAILNSSDSTLRSDYAQWIQLKRKISKSQLNGGTTDELVNEANALEKDLIKRSGAFSDFDKIKNLDWKQVRDGLTEGEAAIEFVHFKSEIDTTNPIIYAGFVVKPGCEHPVVVRLCTEEDLKNILGVLQGNNLSFIERVYGKKSASKTELYQKIWEPLEPFLKDVKTVYYSPSGLLHKVSFSAICKGQDVFLSDVYNFRQMGSTGNLAFENKTEFGELENFLLMGGVNYNSDSTEKKVWDYLPGSLSETTTINTYLQKKKYGVNYFHSNNASESVFKEKISSSSIVHIATHGFFFPDPEQVRAEMQSEHESGSEELKFRGGTNYANWSFVSNKNPLMRSGIVLANANDVWSRDPLSEGEDGILTAQEVSNLDLQNTKLVVLSACETGLGDIKGSEGVFGLQRAFKMAGVKYLIMSLWQVPDKETSEFMILFYKNLVKLKNIPTAFQKTQKAMREKYDPYYWGAFVLIE